MEVQTQLTAPRILPACYLSLCSQPQCRGWACHAPCWFCPLPSVPPTPSLELLRLIQWPLTVPHGPCHTQLPHWHQEAPQKPLSPPSTAGWSHPQSQEGEPSLPGALAYGTVSIPGRPSATPARRLSPLGPQGWVMDQVLDPQEMCREMRWAQKTQAAHVSHQPVPDLINCTLALLPLFPEWCIRSPDNSRAPVPLSFQVWGHQMESCPRCHDLQVDNLLSSRTVAKGESLRVTGRKGLPFPTYAWGPRVSPLWTWLSLGH